MRETRVSLPELGLIAATRGMLGAGIGLLMADRMSNCQRKAVGWTLLLVGALSTVPLALEVFSADRSVDWEDRTDSSERLTPAYYG